MTLKDKIQNYNSIIEELSMYFGHHIYGGFDDMTMEAEKWHFDGCQLNWIYEGNEYGEECEMCSKKEDFTLVFIRSCTGDQFFAIIDNKNEIEDEEEYENFL